MGTAPGGWLQLAQQAYRGSTQFTDTNYRKSWDDSIRAFNNQHPNDSKYNQPSYEKRSKIYRPKTRTVIRKNEAAAAAAFFSNMDVVDITPADQDNPEEVASAAGMKSLLQYRLSHNIPWFQIVLGGIQDAQTVGVVCAHIYWKYKPAAKVSKAQATQHAEQEPEEPDDDAPKGATVIPDEEQGESPAPMLLMSGAQPIMPPQPAPAQQAPAPQPQQPAPPPTAQQAPQQPAPKQQIPEPPPVDEQPLEDEPCVELIEVENLRVHPASNWMDPVGTSPYLIQMIPMLVMDIKARMKSGEWLNVGEDMLRMVIDGKDDSTRAARAAGRADQYSSEIAEGNQDYEIVWVQRHIHRRDDEDWTFYTLGEYALLSDPIPLMETQFHLKPGERPYVMGCCILETHKLYPNGVPALTKGLQDEANEITNQRLDNVKFVLNKKWFVKRGVDADVGGLIRNVPGGVVMLENPQEDVKEVTWPDVTQSAYEEQTRIDGDYNELAGNYSPQQMLQDRALHAPARNMNMLAQASGTIVEYLLRTYVVTFIQPVLNQVIRMEQLYETDDKILSLAAKEARMLQRFGKDKVTDEMLAQEMTLTVNVGMGATDPNAKLQKFIAAMHTYVEMQTKAPPGLNMEEVGKEIFGHLGYQDGRRFFNSDNPQLDFMQKQLQQAGQKIQELEKRVKDKEMGHMVSMEKAKLAGQVTMAKTQLHEQHEDKRSQLTHWRALIEARNKHELERVKAVHDVDLRHKELKAKMVKDVGTGK